MRECGGNATLHAAELREGTWSATLRGAGACVEWPGDNPALRQGDRFVLLVRLIQCRLEVFEYLPTYCLTKEADLHVYETVTGS